jgi:hypothetical protein
MITEIALIYVSFINLGLANREKMALVGEISLKLFVLI